MFKFLQVTLLPKFVLLVLSSLLIVFALANEGWAKRKIAFVVGNDTYDNFDASDQLTNARKDAAAMATTFQRLGFKVVYDRHMFPNGDLTLFEFNRLWLSFKSQVQPGDEVAIYFSGHGMQIGGENYLLHRDAPTPVKGGEELISRQSTKLSQLLQEIKVKEPETSVVIIDACRNNPFKSNSFEKAIVVEAGLARLKSPRGSFVMFSAGDGETALDKLNANDNVQNSVYTRHLIPLLLTKNLTMQQIAVRLRGKVNRDAKTGANHVQIPSYYDGMLGTYCPAGCATNNGTIDPEENSPTQVQSSPQSTAKWYLSVYNNVDFWGGDLSAKGVRAESFGECAQQCALDGRCNFFTYNPENKVENRCFPKDKFETGVRMENLQSGLIHGEQGTSISGPSIPKVNLDFAAKKGVAYVGIGPFDHFKKHQPRPDRRNIAACLNFCKVKSSDCNFLTFDSDGRPRYCKVRRTDFSMRVKRETSAVSFERIYNSVRPDHGPLEIQLNRELHSGQNGFTLNPN